PKGAGEKEKLAALERLLFRERGFHGSRADYYNRSNSYLSEGIDDREGLPITLSLLYMELAAKLGVRVEGVGLPGHFIVRHVPAKGRPELIDVYESAARMSRAEADLKVRSRLGRPLADEDLQAVTKKLLLMRMLHNLLGIARREKDQAGTLRYLDALLTVQPDAAEERGLRVATRFAAGDLKGAREDVEWLYEKRPEGLDLERVEQ